VVPVALGLARHVGCKRLNALAGLRRDDLESEQQLSVAVDNARFAADLAHDAGVEVLIEPINTIDNGPYLLPTAAAALLTPGAAPPPSKTWWRAAADPADPETVATMLGSLRTELERRQLAGDAANEPELVLVVSELADMRAYEELTHLLSHGHRFGVHVVAATCDGAVERDPLVDLHVAFEDAFQRREALVVRLHLGEETEPPRVHAENRNAECVHEPGGAQQRSVAADGDHTRSRTEGHHGS